MKHTAVRLVPYAVNGVVHIGNIKDPALKRLARDKRLQPLIRRGLKEIDSNLELLVPYAVDDLELQLKRYIQYKLGTTVNLSELRSNYLNYYLKLEKYGKPADVLESWGLGVTYNNSLTEEDIESLLADKAVDGVIQSLGRNSKVYRATAHRAQKKGLSVGDYLGQLGYEYKGGNADARSNQSDV